jgi:hypothetical protein
MLSKTTPVLVVGRIEPVIPFWARLDVAIVNQVPECEEANCPIGFAIFAGPGVELMYQTVRSVGADLLESASDKGAFRTTAQQAYLFIEVPDLDAVEARLRGERLVMGRRTTFYGAIELGYAEPAGNIVIFAQMAKADR